MSVRQQTVLYAGCKVNLYLNILGCREDGFHELESLFLPLPDPCDTLIISPGYTQAGITVHSSLPELDQESNILVKAYQLFTEAAGYRPDVHVLLQKNIPVGAGLGGGSSDAAVLLGYLANRASAKQIAPDKLQAIALQVGSDVPFFMLNRPAWVTGIGETCHPVKLDLKGQFLVLISPDIEISTAWAYKTWDRKQDAQQLVSQKQNCLTRRTTEIKDFALTSQDLFFNSFEEVVFEYYPALRRIKDDVLRLGARQCVLSGSGASLVALFEQQSSAQQVLNYLNAQQFKYYTHLIKNLAGV